MPLRPTLKLIASLLALLLVGGATVVLAAGSGGGPAAKKAATVTKAAAPKVMHVACARNGGGKLQYLPDGTTGCKGEVIHFPKDAPVTACQLDKGNSQIYEAKAKLPPPAHPHAVRGMLFVVSGPGKCKAPKYPDSHARQLPSTEKDLKLCAGRRRGTVRVVSKFSKCNDLEDPVVLKALASPENHKPTATPQTVTVAEDGSKPITLKGSDPDGDSLTFSIVSGPSHGNLTGSGKTRVYHPAPNFTGTDSFTFKVADGHGGTDTAKVTVNVGGSNDAPVVTTSSGDTAYSENAAGVAVDNGLTVADSDDANLEGATVRITTGFQPSGDKLEVADQNGISGTYNSGTGVLTLTGTSSKANYQAALRSVKFSSTSDTPSASKTVTFEVSDGDDDSNAASKGIAVAAANDAPAVNTTNSALAYAEGDGQKAVDGGVTVADADSANLSGAAVKIAGGFQSGEDSLSFASTASITGTYNSGTGVLTLTGSATVADYQAALRSVKYENSSANPSTVTRTVSFQVTDSGSADSNIATRNINVTEGNTKPKVTTSAGSSTSTEGSGSPVDAALTVTDPDDTHLEGATVSVSTGFQPGDNLDFADQLGITKQSYDSGTGVLTLTGHATVSDYQAALRTVEFRTTNDSPLTSKTIAFKVNDGDVSSDAATKSVTVTPVNDAPVVDASSGSAAFTEGGSPAAVDPTFIVTDPDSVNLSGARIAITTGFSSADGDKLNFSNTGTIAGSYNSSTGVLTLSGADTVAAYQTAIRSITFSISNTADNPSTAPRTMEFRVTDDFAADSNTDTRGVTVAGTNDAPFVATSGTALSYSEADAPKAVDNALTITDPDSTQIQSATVRLATGFQTGDVLDFSDQLGITKQSYDTGTGVLTLTGTASVSDYQTALRTVTYSNTGDNPIGPKSVGFKVKDAAGADSNEPTRDITINPVNDAPTLMTTSGNLTYTEGDGAKAVDPAIDLADPDSTQFQGATVQISGNFVSADDDLSYTPPLGNPVTGNYNDTTGTLTLSGTGTLAEYEAALQAVKFTNVNTNPSGSKTVSFKATDAEGAESNAATRTIDLVNANTAPTVTTSSGSLSYSEGDGAKVVDGALTVTDPDSTQIQSATVRLATGFETGDVLDFADQLGITKQSYDTGTGVLTLTGTASVSDYQTALRTVTYNHTGDNPGSSKSVGFKVKDAGGADSNEGTKSIDITGVNDAPLLTPTAANLAYSEGDGQKAGDPGITLTDPDSTQIQSATVQITGNFSSADDELSFTPPGGSSITGNYDDTTGKMTLSGTDTKANYQLALQAVKYENVSQNPTGTKTLTFVARDAEGADSAGANRTIDLTPVNDAPVVTTTSGTTPYTEGQAVPPAVDSGVTVSDVDDTNLTEAHVRISSGFQTGDALACSACPVGITPSYNPTTGVLDLSGTDTVANYQAALQSITYSTTNGAPTSPKTVEFKVKDASLDSNAATKNVVITGVNTAPSIATTGTPLAYSEGDGPKTIDGAVAASDPDSLNLTKATVTIAAANFVPADDELTFTGNGTINGSYNDTTGVLTLMGTDTVANYNAVLQSVKYENVNQNPSGSRSIEFQVEDDGALPSNTATRTINLTAVNDAPVVTTTNGSTPYTEASPPVTVDSGVTVSDVDDTNIDSATISITSGKQTGDVLTFSAPGGSGITSTGYNPTTGELVLSGSSSIANYQQTLQSVQFASANVTPVGSKTIQFKVFDGDADSNLPTKEITLTAVNSPPTVNATDANLSFTEDDPTTTVDPGLTVVEPEGDSLSGGSVSITANYQSGQDVLSWTDNSMADLIVKDMINSNAQTIVLTGIGSDAEYQAALRAVQYSNTSQNPSNLQRTITFSATDTPGTATGTDTRKLDVTPVDDPPDAVNDSSPGVPSTTLLEDAVATAVDVLANDTDVDGGLKEITSATDPANGTVALTGGTPGHHTGLTYKPDPNYCNSADGSPSATPDTFQYTLNGGDSATVSMTVTCVNDPPVADDETFNGANNAVGNTTFVGNDPDDGAPATPDPTDTNPQANRAHKTISADILAGDTDVDGPGPLTVTPETKATNLGGSVKIEPDGDFTYEPPATSSCTNPSDFFDYTVEDSDPTDEKTDVGRVTIALSGCVWYVNNNDNDAGHNDGTSVEPFDAIASAETASNPATAGTVGTVYVQDGNDTTLGYTTGLNMNSGEKLIGEAADLVVGTDTLQTGNAGKRPQLTDTLEDVVGLDDGNTVAGIEVDPSGANSGIAGAAGDTGGGTIDDVRIIDTGTAGTAANLELDGTTGTFNISKLTVDNSAATGQNGNSKGVRLNNTGLGASDGVVFNPTGTISIKTTGGAGLDATSTKLGTSTFDDITVASSSTGGVLLDTTQGTVNLGDGSGTDLALTTTSGSAAALRVNSHTAGAVTVPSGGTADLHASGGPAADITTASGSNFDLDDVDSANSANDGINIDGLGAGTFSATSGDIGGADGISFDLNGGSGKVSYPGDIDDGDGTSAVEITGRSGGTGVNGVTLSGPIADSNDVGGTINVSSNTGGDITLSNASKQVNTQGTASPPTGTADGVLFNTNSGSALLTLSGGGLDIDTAAGKGLEASNASLGGTIVVSGSNNTINSTSNRALNVTNTNIGSGGLLFHDISSGNNNATADPVNGIKLSNTGNTAGLTVSGGGSVAQGGDASGGTIQRTTADGIDLANTNNLSLNNMTIANVANAGIYATGTSGSDAGVTNLSFTNGEISSAGDTGAVNTDNGISLNEQSGANRKNIDGTLTVTNNELLGNFGGGLTVAQNDGTISDAAVNLNLITQATSDSIDAGGVQFSIEGTSSAAAGLTKGTFSNNTINNSRDNGIVLGGGNTSGSGAPGTTMGQSSGNPNALGTNKVTINANSIAGDPANKMNTDGILVGSSGKGQVNAEITNNDTITNLKGQGLGIGVAGSVTGTFKVDDNTTNPSNILGSDGFGINIDKRTLADSSVAANATLNAQIEDNVISGYTGYGINGLMRDTNATANLRITNNTVNAGTAGNYVAAINAQAGSSGNASFNPTTCWDITSNTAAAGVDAGAGVPSGIVMNKLSTSAATYKFGIVGLSPSPTTAANAETFVSGLNPGSALGTGFYAGKRAKVENGDNFTSCTLPF
ncbi:MAG TPA: tandem-95 repeat protein [Thermoleophilaceae bacterium]|nr:tandem-95 repeat protein [Thermoleophilaceae bacterium]